jgi:hypothetical protein
MTVQLNRPSERFAHWDYQSETRELIHRREGYCIALETVLSGSDEMLRCKLLGFINKVAANL